MPDDEYTANPYETEVEANRVLKKMQAAKNVEAAKASEAVEARETARQKLRDMGILRGGGGGAGMGDIGIKGIGKKSKLDYAKGGKVSSASKRADGCCVKGKTKGKMV